MSASTECLITFFALLDNTFHFWITFTCVFFSGYDLQFTFSTDLLMPWPIVSSTMFAPSWIALIVQLVQTSSPILWKLSILGRMYDCRKAVWMRLIGQTASRTGLEISSSVIVSLVVFSWKLCWDCTSSWQEMMAYLFGFVKKRLNMMCMLTTGLKATQFII